MNYLLDTNIIIFYNKGRDLARKIEVEHQLFATGNNLAVSIVTLGEINSIIHQLNIGDTRRRGIEKTLEPITTLDISHEDVIERYGEIEAYSQGRHRSKESEFSARNMGKNDLWIAATASAFNVTLVTTDADFSHLQGEFLDLKYIDIEQYR